MIESKFQSDLIKKLKMLFPGCIVLKNDPNYLQGFPDLLILFEDKWAALETKVALSNRPNQKYYVNLLNQMFFARFIRPENEREVLDDLQQAFRSHW